MLLLTDWPEFAGLDPHELGTVTATRRIIDGRYVLDPAKWRAAGWEYRASGIPGPASADKLTQLIGAGRGSDRGTDSSPDQLV